MGLETSIAVERDGLTLGWKLVVAVAAFSLGIYITTVVTPLQQRIVVLEARAAKLDTRLEHMHKVEEVFKLHAASDVHVHKSFDRELERLDNEIKQLEARLQ